MTNEHKLREALEFYADPENYHAIGFRFDRPCGGFADDFSEDHGHDFYDRPMPGKLARETLDALSTKPQTSDEGTPGETPLTDAVDSEFHGLPYRDGSHYRVMFKHALKLERTLQAKERELEEYRNPIKTEWF